MVTKVEWTNPHARFYVDVRDESGNVIVLADGSKVFAGSSGGDGN